VLQPASESRVAAAPHLVPDLAAHDVESARRPLRDVEGIEADDRLRASNPKHLVDPAGAIGGHELQRFAAFLTELIEEAMDGRRVAAWCGPDEPAGVVVHDEGDVLVASAVGPLVDPDPPQAVEQAAALARLVPTRSMMAPTVRQAMRSSSATVVRFDRTASQAHWSSKSRVNRDSCRAQGTAAVTTSCSPQRTRGSSAWR